MIKTKIQQAKSQAAFEQVEKEMHAAFIEAERLVLTEILSKGISVLDFYHVAEHLKKAFEITYGVKSLEATIAFTKYRSILRHDERGIEKIIQHLRYQLKKHPRKDSLKTELNYFKNNKQRCRKRLFLSP